MGDSRSTSIEQWFLELQPTEREAVTTVTDSDGVSLLTKMVNSDSITPASSSNVYYFVNALQRRKLSGYGTWIVGSRSPKLSWVSPASKSPRAADAVSKYQGTCPPSRCQLALQKVPSHLIGSKKVLDASWRLYRLLRLDFTGTISAPWSVLSDTTAAKDFLKSLMVLAGPVDAQTTCASMAGVSADCMYFTSASFAASLVLRRMLAAYEERECGAEARGLGVDAGAFVVRLGALLRDCPGARERLRWEAAGVKVVLRGQGEAAGARSERRFELSAAAEAADNARGRGRGGGGDGGGWGMVEAWERRWRYWEQGEELAEMSAAPTPPESEATGEEEEEEGGGEGGREVGEGHVLVESEEKRRRGERRLEGWRRLWVGGGGSEGAGGGMRDRVEALEALLRGGGKEEGAAQALAGAALGAAGAHRGLLGGAWEGRDGERLLDAAAGEHARASAALPECRAAKAQPPQQPPKRAALAARAVQAPAKAEAPGAWERAGGGGRVQRGLGLEEDPLVREHDDEWTQMGRIEEAARHAEAQLRAMGAGLPAAPHMPRRAQRGREGGGAAGCSGAAAASVGLGVAVGGAPGQGGEEARAAEAEEEVGSWWEREAEAEAGGGEAGQGEAWVLQPLQPRYGRFEGMSDGRKGTARRLHGEVAAFLEEVEPDDKSRRERELIVKGVEAAVAACWEAARVEVYGSYATGLYLPHSDVDMVVMKAQPGQGQTALQLLADRLRGLRWCRQVMAIETASVPVIKLQAEVALLEEGGAEDGRRLAVDVTLYSDREVLQTLGVSYSPIDCRDFAVAELAAFPVMRGLVLVLKELLFRRGLNDSYSGGLSSHSLLLLVIFYFRLVRSCSPPAQECAPGQPLMAALDGDIPAECQYGEWLLRVLQWLSEFPFDSIGLAVSREVPGIAFLGRTPEGLAILTNELPLEKIPLASRRPTDILHLEDPFNQDVNVAKASFRWWQVCTDFNLGWQILHAHQEPPPHMRIFGGVSEVKSPLQALFSLDHLPPTAAVPPNAVAAPVPPRSVTPEEERGGGRGHGGRRSRERR